MKINTAHTAKVAAALAEVQGKARERTYTADDIARIADDYATRMAKHGIGRHALTGTTLDFGGNYHPAKRYKYAFMGTVGRIMYTTSGAYLVRLERTYCDRHTGATLSEAAKAAAQRWLEEQNY